MRISHKTLFLSTLWFFTLAYPCAADPPAAWHQTEDVDSSVGFEDIFQVVQVVTSPEPQKTPAGGGIEKTGGKAPVESSESEESVSAISDPLEPINRAFFQFNDKLYFWLLKPVASGYKAAVPEDGRVGVRNFFSNLTTPIRMVNCLLQGKFKCSGNETIRFLVNTTFGVAGFFDPAKKEFHIEKEEGDFGLTLGIWGIGHAFYIDWPILGSSSLRDTVGFVGDLFLDPRTYLISSIPINAAVWSYEMVNDTSLRMGEYEDLKRAALDPYVALRDAYFQYRQSKIKER